MASSLAILYASTTGHTEHVIDTLIAYITAHAPNLQILKKRIEQATKEDLLGADAALLACGTWNTGGPEGQLNSHMHAFVYDRAKDVDLGGKPVAVIGLGDERYRYTARAGDYLEKFITDHQGKLVASLRILNEPYGQEEKVREWGKVLLASLS